MKVFDASAVFAILRGEPGGAAAYARLGEGAALSVVNAGEILGKLVLRGVPADAAHRSLRAIDLEWVAPDDAQARRVGELGAIKDLSLADRFCIALAEARGDALVTADREWAHVPIRVPVEYIR